MRFTWKEDDRSEQKGEACKIMRRVDFPDKLDAIKLLESEKAKLLQVRDSWYYSETLGLP